MIELHKLKPKFPPKKRKIVGRGGKRGTYSGRGIKGQKARAGVRISPKVKMPLIYRLAKKRGFASLKVKPAILNVGDLQKKFESGEEITLKKLYQAGLLKRPKLKVKILGNGELTKKFIVEAHSFSKSAKEKIEKAGGKAIEIKNKKVIPCLPKKKKLEKLNESG